jgi:hypothetical protein
MIEADIVAEKVRVPVDILALEKENVHVSCCEEKQR